MLKRIINVLLVSAVLAVGLTASVAMANTAGPADQDTIHDDKGVQNANDTEPTVDTAPANGFGTVTSQRASTVHDIGDHSSNPLNTAGEANLDPQDVNRDTPRDGVGNVARNDSGLAGAINTIRDRQDPTNTEPDVVDQGSSPGAHGCLIGELDDLIGQDEFNQTSCTNDPGLPEALRGPS